VAKLLMAIDNTIDPVRLAEYAEEIKKFMTKESK
jgi:hypothetical protein